MAHRGSRALWPENTIAAFDGSVGLGLRYVETDVRVSRDGHVMVFHDRTLERTTNGVGRVDEHDLEDLRRLDAAHNFQPENGYPLRSSGIGIPTLAEVFAAYPDVHFNIDLKGPNMEWALADAIKAAGRQDSVLVGSFIGSRTAKFRRITRGAVATSAGPTQVAAMWAASRRGKGMRTPVQAYQIPFDYRSLPIDRKFIDAIHNSGAQVHFWTVNEPAEMRRLLDLGADGIVTDRPDLLNGVVGA